MSKSLVRSTLVGLALLLSAPSVQAQGVTGAAVTGTIADPGGGGLEGVQVELRNQSTGAVFNATTGADGRFTIDNVPPGGPYTLTAASPGYETFTRAGLQLSLGQRFRLDQRLNFQGEAVEVIVRQDQLDDKNRTGAQTRVREQTINEIPLQGRNFTDLVGIDPRVSSNSVAGQNNRFNNIQIDGGANNDLFGLAASGTPGGQSNAKPISIEAIREFVVQVSPFDVRQGNFAGGLINAITKSGTNEFHGALFGYTQNKLLAGNQDDPTFLAYNVWQYGVAVGGPIVKDKAHFFIAADLQNSGRSFGSPNQLTGDPTKDAVIGFDYNTVARFNAALAKYSTVNAGGGEPPRLKNPDRNVFVKVDTSVLPNSNLELTYNFVNAYSDILARTPASPSISLGGLSGGYQLSNSGYQQANTTNTVRAKLQSNFGRFSNELLAGASFIRDARETPTDLPLVLVNVAPLAAAGQTRAKATWIAAGEERFSQANKLDQNVVQLQDSLSYSTGAHRLTVGTSNEFFHFRNLFLQAANGVWAFNSMEDFEAGKPVAYQRRFGVDPAQEAGTAKFQVSQLGFYAQDEWAPFERLSVSGGIRVDVPFLGAANLNEKLLTNPLPIDTSKVPSGNALWSPRLGVNYDVFGDTSSILRGGVGIFSGRPPYVWVSNAYVNNGIAQTQLSCGAAFGNTPVPGFTLDPNAQPTNCNGTGGAAPPTNNEIDYFDPNTKYPQNLRWALGADQRLPFGIVASVDLGLTRDLNAFYVTDENVVQTGVSGEGRALYGTFNTATGRSTPTRVDTTGYIAQAVKVRNQGNGFVESASVQLQKQFGEVFNLSAGYTFARSFDMMSLTSSQAYSNFQFSPIDGTIQDRARRPSAFDVPHRIVVAGTAQLPYGFGVGLRYTGQSGTPYTWVVNGDANGDGATGNDLVFVPKDPSQITLDKSSNFSDLSSFIDTQQCLREAKGGMVQRGACRNPWFNVVDARISWLSPKIKGEQRIEVQWDIFNLANLINSDWGHLEQATTFETISGSNSFLRVVGYDTTNNRPIYHFDPQSQVRKTVSSPTASRWRMQLGARYVF